MPSRRPDSTPDRLAGLIALLAGHRLAPAEGAELNTLIHTAGHPMRRHLLGSADTADEAQKEVWR